MGNSPLATVSISSPNRTSPRNHVIDTITIHCMAGNLSVESCGKLFADPARKASSNYGIGSDGRIAIYVNESDRSWCSSNRDNDNRAITIEVANDGGAETGWHVSDAAYNSLINLLVDICKRNHINQLLWKGDKTLIGQITKQNMTVHRWFAAKACPGDYLYNKHGEIAKTVNSKLQNGSENAMISSTVTTSNDEYIWKRLRAAGYPEVSCAGIMGNLFAESGLRPNNLQNSFEKSLGLSDLQYTAAVDNGCYPEYNFVNDKAGYGLAQWTFHSRKQRLYTYLKTQKHVSIGDLEGQMDYLLNELVTSYPSLVNSLLKCTSVLEASNLVLFQFEAPKDQSQTVQATRASYGQTFYNKFAGSAINGGTTNETKPEKDNRVPESTGGTSTQTGSFTPYQVKVSIDNLNIRTGPGTNYPTTGKKTGIGVFTIVDESNGWGLLKAYQQQRNGWISLNYTTRR